MQQNEKRTKIILWAVVTTAVIGCALWLLLPHGGTTDCTAEIWIDGQMVRSIYLPQAADEVISLAEYGKEVQLEVKNHRIAFISSDCPDKVCIHNGWLSREGEQAICLPNRVSVTLTDGSTVPVEPELIPHYRKKAISHDEYGMEHPARLCPGGGDP